MKAPLETLLVRYTLSFSKENIITAPKDNDIFFLKQILIVAHKKSMINSRLDGTFLDDRKSSGFKLLQRRSIRQSITKHAHFKVSVLDKQENVRTNIHNFSHVILVLTPFSTWQSQWSLEN